MFTVVFQTSATKIYIPYPLGVPVGKLELSAQVALYPLVAGEDR